MYDVRRKPQTPDIMGNVLIRIRIMMEIRLGEYEGVSLWIPFRILFFVRF